MNKNIDSCPLVSTSVQDARDMALMPFVRHSIIKPFFRCESASFHLNLDAAMVLIGDSDVDICFLIHFGGMTVDKRIQEPSFVRRDGNCEQPLSISYLF